LGEANPVRQPVGVPVVDGRPAAVVPSFVQPICGPG
jgi:hypothetical protein